MSTTLSIRYGPKVLLANAITHPPASAPRVAIPTGRRIVQRFATVRPAGYGEAVAALRVIAE